MLEAIKHVTVFGMTSKLPVLWHATKLGEHVIPKVLLREKPLRYRPNTSADLLHVYR